MGSRKLPLLAIIASHELAPQQLSDRRFRNFFDKNETARPFEVGKTRNLAIPIQFFGLDRRAVFDSQLPGCTLVQLVTDGDLSDYTLPFVFAEAPDDGVLTNLRWYRSRNTRTTELPP